MNDDRKPTLGPDRLPEADIRRDLDRLDGQLGGQNPTTLTYTPNDNGAVDVNALRDALNAPPPPQGTGAGSKS